MKRVWLFLFLCLPSLLLAAPPKVALKDLQKKGKTWNGKVITVEGTVEAAGEMRYSKTGFYYCILKQDKYTLQVRFPLAQKPRPKLRDIVTVQGVFRHTKYGYYLEGRSFQIVGKKKAPKVQLGGMDEKSMKRMAQAMKVLNQLAKLRRAQQNLERFLRGLGINPERLLEDTLREVQTFLRKLGITDRDIQHFVAQMLKRYHQLRITIQRLLKEYEPMLRQLQKRFFREFQRRLQRRIRNNEL